MAKKPATEGSTMDIEVLLDEELEKTAFQLEQANQRLDEFHDYLDPAWLALEAQARALQLRLYELEQVEIEWEKALRRTRPPSN
ncbi:hypothetical protein LZC95_14115 [Pendulispora brunnea]|uniref:Uncharacterized protein n=1 Tax=Pendulispora brunnea TaxID=2905690 RepID=A0ABZ2KHC6_9BACT